MAKKEPYDMTNSYARMERDKRKAIGNPNKNIHHKKNGSNYQKDTGSMVRSTSARQEPEKMSTTMKVLIGVVFVALVAALAAQVKTIDDRQTFAAQLGQKTGDTPVMSRLRFARLSAVKTPDELLRQLRRAISLLHGSVNLLSLAEDIFRWCREQDDLLNHRRRQQRPIEFIRIRWALDYYQAGDAE